MTWSFCWLTLSARSASCWPTNSRVKLHTPKLLCKNTTHPAQQMNILRQFKKLILRIMSSERKLYEEKLSESEKIWENQYTASSSYPSDISDYPFTLTLTKTSTVISNFILWCRCNSLISKYLIFWCRAVSLNCNFNNSFMEMKTHSDFNPYTNYWLWLEVLRWLTVGDRKQDKFLSVTFP